MTTDPEKYFADGCMRCKFGGTPECKVLNWVKELELLRQIILETGLKEEAKWGFPVYTFRGKNIVIISALKYYANIGFFKGVLLSDKYNILQQQGNLQSGRIVRFTHTSEVEKLKDILKEYIEEAILIEQSGKKAEFKKNQETIPDELQEEFENDLSFKESFYRLTPGRQRGYILYFSQPKQSKTRKQRIEKYKEQIFNGKGLNDKMK